MESLNIWTKFAIYQWIDTIRYDMLLVYSIGWVLILIRSYLYIKSKEKYHNIDFQWNDLLIEIKLKETTNQTVF